MILKMTPGGPCYLQTFAYCRHNYLTSLWNLFPINLLSLVKIFAVSLLEVSLLREVLLAKGSKGRPEVNFINVLRTAFIRKVLKGKKRTVKASVSFLAFGFYTHKALCKMLMKLTRDFVFLDYMVVLHGALKLNTALGSAEDCNLKHESSNNYCKKVLLDNVVSEKGTL